MMSFGAYEILITDHLEIITVLLRAVKGLDWREIGTALRENLLSVYNPLRLCICISVKGCKRFTLERDRRCTCVEIEFTSLCCLYVTERTCSGSFVYTDSVTRRLFRDIWLVSRENWTRFLCTDKLIFMGAYCYLFNVDVLSVLVGYVVIYIVLDMRMNGWNQMKTILC